jgi:hypothetical protein
MNLILYILSVLDTLHLTFGTTEMRQSYFCKGLMVQHTRS